MSEEVIVQNQALLAMESSVQPRPPGGPAMTETVLRRSVVIRNPDGLHMRPAAAMVETARRFQSKILVINGDRRSDARDILQLMMLLAEKGSEVTLEAKGPDAAEAIEALAEILASETPPESPPAPKKG